jgi:hypothetical protein
MRWLTAHPGAEGVWELCRYSLPDAETSAGTTEPQAQQTSRFMYCVLMSRVRSHTAYAAAGCGSDRTEAYGGVV